MRCRLSSGCPCPASTQAQTAENRTLCRARALSKREAFVASGRGRRQAAEAGADLRSKYADSPRKASTGYRFDADRMTACRVPRGRIPSTRGESNSVQGASVKKNASVTQTETRFPNGSSSGNCIPESTLGMGFIFRKTPQAESSSRNPRSERVALSQRRSKRKAHPVIPPQTGTHFPLHLPPRKTCAPSIPKLGRRKPKRNRRRSI